MSNQVLVALGANLHDAAGRPPRENCRAALASLAARPGLRFRAVSHWYRSRPIPASDQPDYVNGVARFDSALDPRDLLAILHEVEALAGRQRTIPNAARPLDLDLLAVGDRVVQTPALTLPHPRLQDRAFVLLPLCDVAPDWRHPLLGRTARALCADVSTEGTERLPA